MAIGHVGAGGLVHEHRAAAADQARFADHRDAAAAADHAGVGEPGVAGARSVFRGNSRIMPVSAAVAYWFFVGPSLLLALLSLRGERKRAAYVAERLATPAQQLPPATVI